MTKRCMSKERFEKMEKTYELMKKLVTNYGTEEAAKLLINKGLKVKSLELEVFIQK